MKRFGNNNIKTTVIFTCFNRKDKTCNCIRKLLENEANVSFIIVDDNSSDGTLDGINEIEVPKVILTGNGQLFWAGGMRKGIDYYLKNDNDSDYVLLVNDDVDFFSNAVDKMIRLSLDNNDAVIVGNCCDTLGHQTYGAIKFNKVYQNPMYVHLDINSSEMADTFNCNAVLIRSDIIKKIGNFDSVYTHNFADYDYGFTLKRNGYKILGSNFYVGICMDDKLSVEWTDSQLSRKKRLCLKESPKGLPQKEWNHFLLKNLGVVFFLRYAYIAMIRILLGK